MRGVHYHFFDKRNGIVFKETNQEEHLVFCSEKWPGMRRYQFREKLWYHVYENRLMCEENNGFLFRGMAWCALCAEIPVLGNTTAFLHVTVVLAFSNGLSEGNLSTGRPVFNNSFPLNENFYGNKTRLMSARRILKKFFC